MVFPQVIFLLYWVGFLVLSWTKRKHIHGYEDYVVAGRRQTTHLVGFSLLATAIGASATLGIMANAERIGWPAFWWLGVGVIGLGLQAWLLSARVRETGATTLPDLVGRVINKPAAWLVALVVAVSWVGIVAAQFRAMGAVISLFWTGVPIWVLILVSAVAMIVYTLVGGQFSVLGTDKWQFLLILLAVLLPLSAGIGDVRSYGVPFVFLNEAFGWRDLLIFAVLTGGSYLIGPDMFSRVFCARDGKTARRAVIMAAVGLVFMSLAITWVGVMAGQISPGSGVGAMRLAEMNLGVWGKIVVAVGILSALVSSADTTLLSSAVILNQDVIRKRSVLGVQLAIVGIGAAAIVLALTDTPILQMLLSVFSLYVPAVVPATLVALLAMKRRPHPWVLFGGMIVGAIFGVVSLTGLGGMLQPDRMTAVYGVAVSLVISLVGLVVGRRESLTA